VSRSLKQFVALAFVLAGVFAALGFWQVARLGQRRARNAQVLARLRDPVTPMERLADTLSYRRAIALGTPDYANEIVLTGRSRDGSPGVYLLTPVRPMDSDTAALVIRGWVYSPDAATIDVSRWRETRNSFAGYVARIPDGPLIRAGERPRSIRRLTMSAVRELVPYPVARMYLMSQDAAADTAPARLPAPALDEGSHLNYAITWFSFAAIAIIGAGTIVAQARLSPESTRQTQVD